MIEVTDLSKRYGETVALEGVSVTFESGLIHAILGENGSGKSTLVKLMSGIVAPSAGNIRIRGRSTAGMSSSEIQALGLSTVFQEVLLAPDRSVADNIVLGQGELLGWREFAPRKAMARRGNAGPNHPNADRSRRRRRNRVIGHWPTYRARAGASAPA